MNSFDFLDQLGSVDPAFIAESLSDGTEDPLLPAAAAASEEPAGKPVLREKQSGIMHILMTGASLAACLVLAVGSLFLLRHLDRDNLARRTAESEADVTALQTELTTQQHAAVQTDTAVQTVPSQTTVIQTTRDQAQHIETQPISPETTVQTQASSATGTQLPAFTVITQTTPTAPEGFSIQTGTLPTAPVSRTSSTAAATHTTSTSTSPTTARTTVTTTSESAVTTTESTQTESTPPPYFFNPQLGDLDGDGLYTEADCAILYCVSTRAAAGGTPFIADLTAADLNGDGAVNYADQLALMRYVGLYWYCGYRTLTIQDYLADTAYYNEIYLSATIPEDFGDLFEQAAFVLTINEQALSRTSTRSYETRCAESEDALETVRAYYRTLL